MEPPSTSLAQSNVRSRRMRSAQRGTTLVEVLIALFLLLVGFAGIWATSSMCISITRKQRETVAASQLLQERMEQLQAAGWSQLTDATALCNGVLAADSPQVDFLHSAREVVTVTTYPPVSPAPSPLQIERRNGLVTILSAPPGGFSLRQIVALRVDVHVDWQSAEHQRPRCRELSSVVALGGLLK